MASDSNAPKQRNEIEAKQGTARPGLIYVLGAGLVLIVIVFAVIWALQKH